MIFNGLLICVVFLTLFGLALWPVLFKNSKRFKLVLIAANLIFLLMLLFFGTSISSTETLWQEKRESFRKETLPHIAKKLEGTEKKEYTGISDTELDIEKIQQAVKQFSAEVAE
ncbi:MAG: hypothetical protein J6C30_04225 [Lentisphaeria bacterium]|nr:hypothetical protein [Lentisphaeria bacterium]